MAAVYLERRNKKKLDAGQSPTLARPAAPLAASVQRQPCTKTNKIWLPWQRPSLTDRETDFRLIVCSRSCARPENLATISQVDYGIIGRTLIVKK